MALIKFSTPPTLAGLFFCLASAENAGLLFCPDAIQPHTSVCSGFYPVRAVYTTNAVKQRTGLYSGVSCDLPHSTAVYTRPTQAAIIPPAPRWSVSQRRSTSSAYHIPSPRQTLHRSAQPPYYNKVYKGTTYRRPCQPSGVCSCYLRISGKYCTRRGSPAAGARRAARNYWRLSPQLFSGFRPIANRGQQ